MADHDAKAPDVELAERIVNVLSDRGLIRAADADRIRDTLIDGSTTQDDWRFWIEQQIAEDTAEASNGEV